MGARPMGFRLALLINDTVMQELQAKTIGKH